MTGRGGGLSRARVRVLLVAVVTWWYLYEEDGEFVLGGEWEFVLGREWGVCMDMGMGVWVVDVEMGMNMGVDVGVMGVM